MIQVLVLNNRDSFVHNLMQLLEEDGRCHSKLVLGEEIPWQELDQYQGILLSPGPGTPAEAPGLMQLIERTQYTHSILGICLGHQAIAEHFAAKISPMARPLHGHKSSLNLLDGQHKLWQGLQQGTAAGRYHSWEVNADSLSPCLKATAISQDDDCVMALRHCELPLYGLQFHPESIISESGALYITNWLSMTEELHNNKH